MSPLDCTHAGWLTDPFLNRKINKKGKRENISSISSGSGAKSVRWSKKEKKKGKKKRICREGGMMMRTRRTSIFQHYRSSSFHSRRRLVLSINSFDVFLLLLRSVPFKLLPFVLGCVTAQARHVHFCLGIRLVFFIVLVSGNVWRHEEWKEERVRIVFRK